MTAGRQQFDHVRMCNPAEGRPQSNVLYDLDGRLTGVCEHDSSLQCTYSTKANDFDVLTPRICERSNVVHTYIKKMGVSFYRRTPSHIRWGRPHRQVIGISITSLWQSLLRGALSVIQIPGQSIVYRLCMVAVHKEGYPVGQIIS